MLPKLKAGDFNFKWNKFSMIISENYRRVLMKQDLTNRESAYPNYIYSRDEVVDLIIQHYCKQHNIPPTDLMAILLFSDTGELTGEISIYQRS